MYDAKLVSMHMIYKMLVQSLPDVHLRKLQALVHQCFDTEMVAFSSLRHYDYAIVAQTNGRFVGALFARISIDGNQHEISKFCVAPGMRNNGLGSDMLSNLQSELPPHAGIVLYVDRGTHHDRLVQFYERNGLHVAAQNEKETMMARKPEAPRPEYKGDEGWPE